MADDLGLSPQDALTHFRVELSYADLSADDVTDTDPMSNLYGNKLWGQIQSYSAPSLVARLLEWPSQADGEQVVPWGIENMEARLVSSKYAGEYFGLYERVVTLVAYNVLQTGVPKRGIKHTITGRVIEVDPGDVEVGTLPTISLMLRVRKYVVETTEDLTVSKDEKPKYTESVHIDIDQMRRTIGGVDQLLNLRRALKVGKQESYGDTDNVNSPTGTTIAVEVGERQGAYGSVPE